MPTNLFIFIDDKKSESVGVYITKIVGAISLFGYPRPTIGEHWSVSIFHSLLQKFESRD